MHVDGRNLSINIYLEVVVGVGFHPAKAHDPFAVFSDEKIRVLGVNRVLVWVTVVCPRLHLCVSIRLSSQPFN